MLDVRAISKRFGHVQAVRELSFQVAPGETYGLLGPNGAGKSTAISVIAGLLVPDDGDVHVHGERITTRSTAARGAIGLVPQEVAVYPDLTARENLRFFGRLYGLAGADLDARVDEVLEVIGLTERAGDRSSEFSGGMNRRLNIGIGLLHRPQLLILDEPTVGVDPQSRNAILDSVEQLSGAGMAVLYTTHYMEEAERLCDRIGIIDEGRLQAEGTRRELTTSIGERDTIRIEASGHLEAAALAIQGIDGVVEATSADGSIRVLAVDAGAVIAEAIAIVSGDGGNVSSVEIAQPDLEAVFLHLTGKALRD
ncbi:ATP-binding cassette domain-containing protein [Actinomarinicola tropica]|uniref:ATP-binding cassette domain-containing protein n=1 Tax=Actinomarinicola tropica TaxID=2789776 RepID=A0A5Q2RLZ2_9ACTN|nr:ATP-binding cassette domain-containing protein [Actinomarinicola tropica]